MNLVYRVTFRPGRYRYTPNLSNLKSWMIGRIDDGKIIGFAFTEEDAKHIVLALNAVDGLIAGTADHKELLRALEKLQH